MLKTITILFVCAIAGTSILGCRAAVDVDPKGSSQVPSIGY